MEYQKIINLLDNLSNQPSNSRTKNWIEINDQSRGNYNANSDIRFVHYKSEINNTEINIVKDIDIVMPIHNLIEYSDNYSKTIESLWQHYKNETNDILADSESFKCKVKIIGNTPNNSNKKMLK